MNELFDMPENLSPRLAWMKRHEVSVAKIRSEEVILFRAFNGIRFSGFGDTEEEAVHDFAINNNLRLWNEESPALPSGKP